MLWVQCDALLLLLHHEVAGAGGSGFECPNSQRSSPSSLPNPTSAQEPARATSQHLLGLQMQRLCWLGEQAQGLAEGTPGAVLGYFVGESPPADVGIADMGTAGHSDEPQTYGHQEHGTREGPCTAATLTQLHSLYMGKITPWKQAG